MPKVNFPIPLTLQLSDGDATKYCRALVYNPSNTLITAENLDHVAAGLYSSDDVLMPNVDYVRALYYVYDDSGYSTLSADFEQAQEDVFEKIYGVDSYPLTGILVPEIELYGVVQVSELIGQIQNNEVTGLI